MTDELREVSEDKAKDGQRFKQALAALEVKGKVLAWARLYYNELSLQALRDLKEALEL